MTNYGSIVYSKTCHTLFVEHMLCAYFLLPFIFIKHTLPSSNASFYQQAHPYEQNTKLAINPI